MILIFKAARFITVFFAERFSCKMLKGYKVTDWIPPSLEKNRIIENRFHVTGRFKVLDNLFLFDRNCYFLLEH